MRHPVALLGLAAVLLGDATIEAAGQTSAIDGGARAVMHRFAGTVLDSAGGAVAFAELRLTTSDGHLFACASDGEGHFTFAAVPAGRAQLRVRRLGFLPSVMPYDVPDADLDVASGARITLVASATQLTGIEVSDSTSEVDGTLAGFYARRRSNNFGHYLDRAQLEATHAQRPSEALRTVPGVLVQPSRRVGNVVRVRNCRPTVWLDGVRVPDAELDEVASLEDVAAVEVYKSLAGLPQQFIDRSNPCGAIVIWSRHR